MITRIVPIHRSIRILALAFCALPTSASALTFAQTFFVPLTDTDLQTSWQAIGTGATIGSSIKSVISIAVPKANTVIYYDQWEDGYDVDPSAPAVATTLIWGDGNTSNGTAPGYPTDIIPAGGVIVLNNTVALPRVATSFFYDGRDRISTTNTIAVARVGWPISPGPLIGTSAEAYDTRKFGTYFQMPVGTLSAGYQQFEYTSIHIMAAQDNTLVQVDSNADGTVDQSQTLNMGQTMFVNGGVATGATVTSSKPVEVHEVTGDIGSSYESRTFAVRPTAQWSSGYFAPVTTTISTSPHLVILYNPGVRAITVSYEGLSTTGTIIVPSKGNAIFTMPQDSAAHFFTVTGEPFYAVGANDAGSNSAGANQNYDWGYALMPDTALTTSIIAPFAPGADDTSAPIGTPDANGSPVWVTPTNTTTVYVNYSGDRSTGPSTAPDGSKYDVSYLIPKLGVQKIYNPTTFDMSKSLIFTTDSTGLAGGWGEDPATSGAGLPYLDLGYAIIPFASPIFSKFAALSTDVNANGVIDQGDTVLFTLFLNNDGVSSLVSPAFTDSVPAGTTYVPNSTVLNGVPVSDDATGTAFPLDGAGITPPDLAPGASATVKFRVSINNGTKKVTNIAQANSTSVAAPMVATVSFPISPIMITGNVYNDTNGLTDGIVNGTATNAGGAIYANIVSDGVIQQVYLVDPDGTFRFINIPGNNNYTITLSTTRGTVDSTPPAASLPAGYVNTGENLGLGVANDGIVDGSLSFPVVTTNVANANFGIERAPTAIAASSSSQANPGGATTVTAPTLSGTDPEDASVTTFIINTLPTNGTLYYNGVAVTVGQSIPSYNSALLKLDPNDGAITATFTYSAVDAASKSSTPATVTMPFTTVSVSGIVYDDADGTTNNTVDGIGSNAGGTLYVNLVTGGNVAQVLPVAADGTFIFLTVPAATYTIVLSTTQGTIGSPAPAASLPSGYVTTAEKLGTGTGNDGTADGIISVTVNTTSVINARFGFDRLPTAVNVTAASQTNPAGTVKVAVPTISGTDPEDASVSTIVLNTLGTNGTLYYNNVATTAGQTITSFNPALLTIDPTGATATTLVASFTYSVKDAAGLLSPAATVTMPFTGSGISLFGNVFNDANGLSDSIVNGTGTNAGGLFAILSTGGTVSQSVAVASTGAYAFPAVSASTNYTVTLSTTAGTVGSAPPAVSLPSGYVSTGEFIGTGAGNDGTVNGSLAVAVASANISNANFGIDRTPTATALTATMANPGGTTQVTVPTLDGTDPEDGSLSKFVINTLPSNGTLYYNGSLVTLGQTITGFNPTLLKLDPNDGAITVSFTYSTVDAAGKSSPVVSCAITFTSIGISGTIFDDANGLTDSIVNGTGTNAGGTLYANLVRSGNVAQVATVAANGTYSFGTVAINTTYTVVLSTTQGTVGAAAPSAALPSAYVNTGEFIGTAAGNDGFVDGSLIVATLTSSITNANFGIEALPTASAVTAASQVNPAGTNQVTVPTLTGTDPEDASITKFTVLSLPTNGTLYYNGTAVTVGQLITGYTASLLKFDPIDGVLTATFNYAAVDAAGKSSTAATVTMPFTTIGIMGIVFNDTNGLTDGIVNGTGTNASNTLYANLVSGGNVVQVQDVQLAGTYNFLTVVGNTTYTVVISTTRGVVGSAAPAAALPSGYVNTGEFIGATTGNDGSADGSLTVAVIATSVINANFGIEQPPFASDVTAASQLNPAGTAQVIVPTLTGTDPEDTSITSFKINTLPSNGTLYYNGSAVTVGQTIASYNASLLKLDPNDGAITVTFTFSSVDAAGRLSAAATATMPFTAIGLSGNVYNDANGLLGTPVNTVDGSIYAGATIYANLVSGTTVAQVATVTSGAYSFGTVAPNTSYTVVISTTQGTVGSAAPAAALPSGYVNTGENIGTGTGSDGSPNGLLSVTTVTSSITNANFGVERMPTANNVSASSQLNPAGTSQVTVPTLTGTDPEDASITTFIINTLPSNGTLYYNGTAVTVGQSISSYNSTLLKLDPNDGAITATFTYSVVDAAGKSSTAATATMPFTTISITGNVFDDANGLTDSIVNGIGTNAGSSLYANLVSGGNVAQVQAVQASGAYSFLSVIGSTTYTVVLSTTQGTVGSAAPAAALPSGYVNTGENIGAGTGSDGSPNGSLAVAVITTSVTNANFGVERPPTANNISASSQPNPAGTAQVTVPTLTGTDPEDASITTFIINTLPSNGTLYYNGTAVTVGQTISSYNSTLLKLDPNDGAITATFTYSAVDAAGKASTTATVTMPFTAISISGNVYNDANGLLGTPVNTVDGTAYAGATLYANLVSGTTVAQVSTVTSGAYSFGTVAANTSYTVVLSTTQGTVGSAAPAAALPSGYVNTGENIGAGTGSDGSPNGSLAVAVITTSVTNANFGVRTQGIVSGHLYIDTNGSGTQQVGEPDLANVDILITDAFGGTKTVTTDTNGNWTASVPPGTTTADVQESDPQYPSGYTQTQGDDPTTVSAVAGTTVNGGTDGYFLPGSISGSVLADTNNDNTGDSPITGVVLSLVDSSGVPILQGGNPVTATTALNGSYSFGNLPPGTYGVVETQPSGYNSVSDKDGGNPNEIRPIILLAGVPNTGNNFIEEQPGSISGTVFKDTDGDGNADAPLANVTLRLLDSVGSPVLDGFGLPVIATTLANGTYSFGGLTPGTYCVHEDQPSNYGSVSDTDGANNNVIGNETPITVTAGNNNGGNNFIEIELGVISGYVLLDTDNNGSGDFSLPGVVLNLLNASGSPVLDSFGAPIQVASGLGGFYSFTLVPVGSYRVSQNQPVTYGSVSDVDGANNNVIGDETPILMTPGLVIANRNFVEIQFGSIAGVVRKDTNNDGSGDAPMVGVIVTLFDAAGNPVDGDPNTAGVQPITRVTDAIGAYFFGSLYPGSYQVSETQPSGFGSVSDVDGGNPNLIGNITAITVAPGQNVIGRDFVEIEFGSISGFVNAGASPLANITLTLLNGDGSPVDGDPNTPGVQLVTTVTDSNGRYTFTGVVPGEYQVAQTQPFGYNSLGDLDGGDLNIIGDVTRITVIPGQENSGNNFVETLDTCPDTWAEWKFQHPGETSYGNPDDDALDNLSEFAFAKPATSGAGDAWHIQPSAFALGTIEGVFTRPKGAWQNVTYSLEYIDSISSPIIWSAFEIIPAMVSIVDNGDCTETVTIHDLETLTGMPDGKGFVRIRADLDEDKDGTIDHTSYTEVEGWKETALGLCCRTYSNPFLRSTVFNGTIDGVSSQTLDLTLSAGGADLATLFTPGVSYYAEVTVGANEGHRFDIVSASGSSITLATDTDLHAASAPFNTLTGALPASLAGDQIVIRRHWTLGEMFPPSGFGATADRNTADQVQLYANGQWIIFWLYNDGTNPARWVKTGDNTYADQGAAVIPPGQGLFFNNRTAPTSILAYGEVRTNDFVRPISLGSNLIAGGYPVDQSPTATEGREMTTTAGFFGSRDIATADTFYVWDGDTTPGSSGYSSYFLNNNAPRVPSVIKWVKVGDSSLLSRGAETLLKGDASVFFRSKNGLNGYTVPTPWIP